MLASLNSFLWGYVLILLLIGVGVWFSVSSRLVQLRYFRIMFHVISNAFDKKTGQVSSFQALILSVAGRVGAGNIAGVAVAITLGGPGAIFWMWVIALIGMATSFFECTLAQVFKQAESGGTFRGGPAYYMHRGINKKWMGSIYSLLLAVSVGVALIALQSFTVANSLATSFSIPTYVSGMVLAAVTALVIFGGVKRIAEVAEWIVPFMAFGYFLIGIVVVALNIELVPDVLNMIIKGAFGIDAAVGGGFGVAILMGVQRGLFSNEAGLGHAANVAAVAYVKHPVNQGIVQSLSVFIDTIILCTVTAMIILMSDVYIDATNTEGVALTQLALTQHLGDWSGNFVSIALVLFAFTTILYLYYLGENGINFFSGNNQKAFTVYRFIIIAQIVWGALLQLSTVFAFADFAVGLLALGNLIALVFLFKTGKRVMLDYESQVNQGIKQPSFSASRFKDLKLDKNAWPD
ncbi:alanine/glycine:cation symporter family protein [Aliikangiella sp. IMCC44632]